MSRRSLYAPRSTLALGLTIAAAGLHCGGDEPEPPPPPPTTAVLFDLSDPCGADVPSPSNLFFDEDGQPETTACPLPSAPIDAAIALAQRYDGAPVDSEARIPFDNSVDPQSLSSTVAFDLAGTSSAATGLPTVVFLARTGSATVADGWTPVDATVTYDGTAIRARPTMDLDFDTFHAVVVTRAVQDTNTPRMPLEQSDVVAALVGDAEVTAGAAEGLDAAGAARLERLRQQLAPLVALLQSALPPIPPEEIASIHGFTTELGDGHLTGALDTYFEAMDGGRYRYEQENRVVPFSEVYPGLPAIAWEGVAEFRAGTITAPRFLDEAGRFRPGWGTQAETIDIPFTLSVPASAESFGVAVFLPGWGRGKIDGRALAPRVGEGAGVGVLTIDLRCHGDRSMDASGVCGENRTAQEVAMLEDDVANNDNPEIMNGDSIPDASGLGFYPGDPRALRDSQIAAILEVVHVLHAIREGDMFDAPVNIRVGSIHLIAQGYMAPIAMAAAAHIRFPTNNLTVQLAAPGAGYEDIILDGPTELRASFTSDLPEGVETADARAYLQRLDETLLRPLRYEPWAEVIKERTRLPGSNFKVLMNHSRVAEFMTADARQNVIDAFSLPAGRRSQHNNACDDFFIYTCRLGDNPAWLEEARAQFASFITSGGVTFSAPAP